MTLPDRDPQSLRAAFFAQLSDPARATVEKIVLDAGAGVYAVGGVVRDLIMGRPFVDVDLTTEGDAIDLTAKSLSGGRVTAHQRFRTASLTSGRSNIDVATARSETYARPGALPRVAAADIESDLRRRDFSMNGMALRLDGVPRLLDPAGGVADIEARMVRVLHPRSFEDDATRIFRAIRYAVRLGFTLEAETTRLLGEGLAFVPAISGARLRREVELMLLESTAPEALEAAGKLGALSAIHPDLGWDAAQSLAWVRDDLSTIPRLPFGFALLASGTSTEGAAAVIERLRLRTHEATAVTGLASMRGLVQTLRRPAAKPSGVVVLLDRYPPATVAAFAATASDSIAAGLALRYLAEWRHIHPLLHGDELIAMGVPEGPQVHRGLQLIRASRLDGWAADEGDERALALRFAKSIRDSSAAPPISEQHNHGF